jgi:rubrerythrin
MIEAFRTFWGKLRGRGEVVVEEGQLWRCTQCNLIFITKSAGENHKCQDQKAS